MGRVGDILTTYPLFLQLSLFLSLINIRGAWTKSHKIIPRTTALCLQLILKSNIHLFQPSDTLLGLFLEPSGPLEFFIELMLPILLDCYGSLKDSIFIFDLLILRSEIFILLL